jgi:hypothetical protein
MVELTGVSKATFIRVTLTERLSALGTLVPDAPASITPTRALGRLASAKRKATRCAHLYPSDYNDQIAKFEAFVADG